MEYTEVMLEHDITLAGQEILISLFLLWGLFNQFLLNIGPIASIHPRSLVFGSFSKPSAKIVKGGNQSLERI